MRAVSIEKPHIFHTYRGWACCKSQTWIGWGDSPKAAYASWKRVNA